MKLPSTTSGASSHTSSGLPSDSGSSWKSAELSIREAYEQSADQYDRFYDAPINRAENLIVQEWLESHVRGTVLDVGAGTGLFLDLVEGWPEELYLGLDLSERMLEVAKRKHPRHHFFVGDMCDLADVEDDAIDTLTCLWAFQYAMRPWDAAEEFHRVLKPGGKLLLLANAPAHLKRVGYIHKTDEPPNIKWGAHSLRALFRRFKVDIHGLNAFCDDLPFSNPHLLKNLLKTESLLLSLKPSVFMYLMMEATCRK